MPYALVDQGVGPEPGGVDLSVGLRPHGHRSLLPQGHARERIFVEKIVGDGRHAAGGVLQLSRAEHQHVAGVAEVVEGVAPALLLLREGVDIAFEEEGLGAALVPAAVGRKHVVLLPEIDVGGEPGLLGRGVVFERTRLDEHRIGVHVHVAVEEEEFRGVVVLALVALDYLSVLALHRGSAGEHGDAVPGVVVEHPGAEYVLLLVAQLDQGAAELGEVEVDQVVELFAGELGLALDQPDVADAVDDAAVDVPHRTVADQIGAVVQESRVHSLPF